VAAALAAFLLQIRRIMVVMAVLALLFFHTNSQPQTTSPFSIHQER
jgi:hypothetical protein